VSGITAIAATAVLLMLFRFPPRNVTLPESVRFEQVPVIPAKVELTKAAVADVLLKEETAIRDLRPLFLPTEFNATLPEPRLEPGRTFLDQEAPRFGFAEADLVVGRTLPPVAMIHDKPAHQAKPLDVLKADVSAGPLYGFGRRPLETAPLPPRGGYVEVFASESGERVLAEMLPAEAQPAADKAWEPFELLAKIDAAGLMMPLVVTTSSRNEEVDAHYRNFLARTFRIGERLRPGFYRIVVGP
jgi:hypothetical protein